MEALWATILFSGFALEVIIRHEEKLRLMNLYFATMPGRRKFAVKYNIPDTLF